MPKISSFLDLAVYRAGESEIADFRAGLQIEQDVGRFDVAVEDAVFMGVGEAVTDPRNEADHLSRIDRHAIGRMEQRLPRHVLHDDIEHAVHLAEVENSNEIRMVEFRHRLRLGFEAFAERGVLAEFLGQDLDGHGAVQRLLDGAINRTHASGGDQGFDFVTRKERSEFVNGGCFESLRMGFAH